MILAFDGTGNVEASSDPGKFMKPSDDGDDHDDEVSNNEPQTRSERTKHIPPRQYTVTQLPKEDGRERHKSDYTLYSYYLGSAGFGSLVLFFVATAAAAVGEKMPRTSNKKLFDFCYTN